MEADLVMMRVGHAYGEAPSRSTIQPASMITRVQTLVTLAFFGLFGDAISVSLMSKESKTR